MRTVRRPIVSALIFSSDNKLLMGKKDPKGGGVYSDCWHIPGGGIDKNETKEQALVREIKEEIGITITNAAIKLVSNDGRGASEKVLKETGEKVIVEMEFNVYKVTLDKNSDQIEVKLSDDLIEYKWFDLSRLSNVKLTPPSITLFQKLGYIK